MGFTKETISLWGLCVSCDQEVQVYWTFHSNSGVEYELTKGHRFFFKWGLNVKYIVAIFILSQSPHKQKVGRPYCSKDEEAETCRNSWHLKRKCENKRLSFKNAYDPNLFLSAATRLLRFIYPNSPTVFDRLTYLMTINGIQFTKATQYDQCNLLFSQLLCYLHLSHVTFKNHRPSREDQTLIWEYKHTISIKSEGAGRLGATSLLTKQRRPKPSLHRSDLLLLYIGCFILHGKLCYKESSNYLILVSI